MLPYRLITYYEDKDEGVYQVECNLLPEDVPELDEDELREYLLRYIKGFREEISYLEDKMSTKHGMFYEMQKRRKDHAYWEKKHVQTVKASKGLKDAKAKVHQLKNQIKAAKELIELKRLINEEQD
jgi:hypothetical protein